MLKGRFVGLRAIEKSDLFILLKWRNQPEYRRFFREYRELSSINQEKWFESRVLQDKNTEMFSIIDLSSNELIGACGLCYIDWINRNADVSIYIGKDNLYIDDFFAVDTMKLIIEYAFDELNLHRLWTELYDFDEKKIKLFKKLDFKLEGRHKETHWTEGMWHDSIFFGKIRKEGKDE